MKMRLAVAVALGMVLAVPAGCALLQPPVATVQVKIQEVSDALGRVDALLTQLRAAPVNEAAPTTQNSNQADVLAAATKALEQLRADLENAKSTEAQQQAALQAAQSAALTFGGQYGALIAAGLGILSVLLQGMANAKQAHQSAQAAQETAQLLAGRLPPPSGRA